MTAHPVFDYTRWDPAVVAAAGTTVDRLPGIVSGHQPVGIADGIAVGGGTIDALAEQVVAGANEVGDVLVILGTTLITWGVVPEAYEVPGETADQFAAVVRAEVAKWAPIVKQAGIKAE